MRSLRCAGVVLALWLGASSSGAAQTIQVSRENRTVAVTATDKVEVPADSATVHIGFIAYGRDSDDAYAKGSRISNGIEKSLRGAGVPKEAIESESQGISEVPVYQNQKLTAEEQAGRRYQLTQSWIVRTGAEDGAKVLDLAIKAGANQSGQIEWSLRDENAPQTEAGAKALERARSVAAGMATQLQAKLGALLYASNETQGSPVRPLLLQQRMVAGMADLQATEPLAINPRRIEKIATVHAVFAIE